MGFGHRWVLVKFAHGALHPGVLPSCQPKICTVRRIPHQPTNFSRAECAKCGTNQPTSRAGQGRPWSLAQRLVGEGTKVGRCDIKICQNGLFHASSASQVHLVTTVHPEIASGGPQWPFPQPIPIPITEWAVRRAGVPGEGAVTTVAAVTDRYASARSAGPTNQHLEAWSA